MVKTHIKPLTSLRFLFALMVFLSHLDFFKAGNSQFLKQLYERIFYEGYIGVSFFFILSGFIISYNYQDRLIASPKNKINFYIARFARIYPLHFLTFLLAIPLSYQVFMQNKFLGVVQTFTNVSLTQSFIPIRQIYFSYNAPSWSLSDEMFFYMLFPFIFSLIYKEQKFKLLLIFISLISIPVSSLIIPEVYHHHLFYINPLFRIVDFLIGFYLYNIYKNFKTKRLKLNFNWLEVFAILVFIIFFSFHRQVLEVARYSYYYWLPMALIIFIFSFQKGFFSKILSHKFLIHLGEISFGFYMFHQLILRYFLKLNERFLHWDNMILIAIMVFLLSLIISHYAYLWYEKPMNSYVKNKAKKFFISP